MKRTVGTMGARIKASATWRLVIPAVAFTIAFLARVAPAYGIQDCTYSLSKFRGTVTYTFDTLNNDGGIFHYRCKKGKLSDARSSNEEVADTYYFDDDGALNVSVNGPGKATITYTYKGKTYAVKVVVKKYKNPLKTLKIGARNYAGRFKRSTSTWVNGVIVKGKRVKITPASGWKLKSIRYGDTRFGFTKIKNGSRFPASAVERDPDSGKLGSSVFAVLQNKKDGRLTEVWINFQS